MPKSCSAFWMPLTAMFQKPAELLVTNANLYLGPPPAPGAAGDGADAPPDSVFLLQPIDDAAASTATATSPYRIVFICRSPVWSSCLGQRGAPRIEDAHITQAVGPGH